MAERIDLDAALADLSAAVSWPATPGIVTRVAAALDERPARRGWAGRGWAGRWPRAVIIAIVVSLLLAATAAAAALLIPGLRLTLLPSMPPASVASGPLGTRLALGDRVAPDAVSIAVPGALGAPDEVYVNADGSVVSLVYASGEDMPEVADTGIGLLVQEIRGDLNRELVEKLVAEVGAIVTPVTVAGSDGFWITGPPHLVRYRGADGLEHAEMTRLVGDTLVWQVGDALYRIESGLGMDATVRIGASIPSSGTP